MAVIWIINQYGGIPRAGIHGRHYQFAKRLSSSGNKVYLICASNHHFLNHKSVLNHNRIETVSENRSVLWLRTINYSNSNSLMRFMNWFVFALRLLFIKTDGEIQKPDIIYYSSLSLIGSISAEMLSKRYGTPYIFEERDIWPMTLTEIKSISHKNPLVLFLQALQIRAYRKADRIVSPIPASKITFMARE